MDRIRSAFQNMVSVKALRSPEHPPPDPASISWTFPSVLCVCADEDGAVQQVHAAAVGERREARRGGPVRLRRRGSRGARLAQLQAGAAAPQQADPRVPHPGNPDGVSGRFVAVSLIFPLTFNAVSSSFLL